MCMSSSVDCVFRCTHNEVAKSVSLFIMPVYLFICPHETAWFPLGGFSWSFMCRVFTEIFWHILLLMKIIHQWHTLYVKANVHLWNITAVGLCDWDRLCCLWGMSWGQRNSWLEYNNWKWLIPNLPLDLISIFVRCYLWSVINLLLR